MVHPSLADVEVRHLLEIRQLLEIRPPRHPVPGMLTARLRDTYRRGRSDQSPRQRVPAHMLALVTAGRASFTVDFAAYVCRPGGLLWVRPGQYVGFPPPGVDATLVLFDPEFPHPGDGAVSAGPARWPTAGTYWQPVGEDEEAIVDGISQLEIDYARIVAGERIPHGVLRHHLAALLLRVSQLDPEGETTESGLDSEILARYREEIEARFAHSRQVEAYAATLGCSVRTLTRASLAATGRSAKQLVDDRVALEAKRLLAESDLPVADIGARLGFTEPTNFGRFFGRTVGTSPGQFRAESRRLAAEADQAPSATSLEKPLAVALAKAGSQNPSWD
jgi:AraC-like DNA-binding protein